MSRPRLLFYGHSHHLQTGSSAFFLDLLQPHFDVATLWDRSWREPAAVLRAADINAHAPDLLVFYQVIVDRRELRRVHCRNVTWVVMHDGIHYRSSRYRKYAASGIKSLHFTRASEAFFEKLGYECRRVQYFPDPAALTPRTGRADAPALFVWLRRDRDLSWTTVKTLLGDLRPRRTIVRLSADPGYAVTPPPAEDLAAYNIEVHEGWVERDRYLELLASCDLCVAPRRLEGIGMAALEAMALGLAVIAPDTASLNEYIRHGDNGYLFDPLAPAPLDLSRWCNTARAARRTIEENHPRWLQAQATIVEFLKRPPARVPTGTWRALARLGL